MFFRKLLLVLFQTASIRVYVNVIKACRTENFCIHVATAITPKIKFAAILAERDLTAVTVDNSGNFPTKHAGGVFVCHDDHDMSINICDEKAQSQEDPTTSMIHSINHGCIVASRLWQDNTVNCPVWPCTSSGVGAVSKGQTHPAWKTFDSHCIKSTTPFQLHRAGL